ncbi:MAG: hypothetical protein ACTH9H_11880 [Galactobacter sp.]
MGEYPNPRVLVIQYLAEHLDVPVSSQVPKKRPGAFVTVLNAGGPGRLNQVIEEVALTVESWDNDDLAAETRATRIRALLERGPFMRYREYSAPAYIPDESGQYRYRYTFTIRFKTSA